jgi:hypothetical protein
MDNLVDGWWTFEGSLNQRQSRRGGMAILSKLLVLSRDPDRRG